MTLKGYIVGTKGNTGRGIASIVENNDYTITINLTDGTSYTTDPIAGFTEVAFDENYDLVVTKTDGTQITVETDLDSYRSLLEGYKSDAETAESNASGYATSASGSASTATTQATLARSYAKGDTSSRTGEATDNADYYRGLSASSASSSASSASNSETQALKSEGYAVGKQNGTDVTSDSVYYHNNAKHYADEASTSATNASASESTATAMAGVLTNCSATATTLSAGSNATASYSNGVFSFGIPKGADGSLASGVLAPTYSSSATYEVGDYVYYSGDLYRCVTAITTAEAWTAGHWAQVALADDVSDLRSEITQLEEDGQGFLMSAFINGSLSSGVVDTSVKYRVTSNEKFVFDRDIVLTPDVGFRFGIHSFGTTGAAFVSDSGWITTAYKISAGTYFKIVIQEISKTSGVANIPVNVHAVKLSTVISDTISDYTAFKSSASSDLSNIKSRTGTDKSISFSYSGNHSSENDILKIDVPQGTAYTVNFELTGSQSWCELFRWSNGTKASIGSYTISSAFPLTLTANTDIDGFSVYWSGSSSGSAKLSVEYIGAIEKSFSHKIDFIEDCIDETEVPLILANGTPPNTSNADCVRTVNAVPVKCGDTVEFVTDRPLSAGATKYIYGVYGYNSSSNLIVNLSPADRATKGSRYLVDNPDVVGIRYAVTERDSSDGAMALRTTDFEGYSASVIVSGNKFESQYNGEKLSVKKGRYNAVKTSLFSPTITDMGSAAPQGFAIYNGNVIQLYSNADKAAIFNFDTGVVVASLASNVGHGNCIDFLNEKADASDLFPIAIVGDGTSNIAYEVRIQTSGITVRKTLKFPTETVGYYVGTMVDKLNNILYTVGYLANSCTDATNNKMVIAKWDYSELTANGDGTYTPQFVEKFNVPFITTIQQPVFFNGRLHILSSKASNGAADTNIYVIDPYRKGITNVLSEFPSPIKNVETEAIYFYDDGYDVYMFIKNYESNVPYYKVAFNS